MINVNRQYGHLGGKMRGVIASNLRRAGYAVAPLTALPTPAPTTEPVMVPTNPTPAPFDAYERHRVEVVDTGDGNVMITSYRHGVKLERYEGPWWLVTDEKIQIMRANLEKEAPLPAPRLSLL